MISVCIATYNGEKYIQEQIKSILSQLNEEDEIIVSDDSSTDMTVAKIEQLNDVRITVLKDNTFRSPIYNIENALKEAKGEYIFLADQDDVWLPNKVEESLKYLKEKSIVMSDAKLVDSELNVLSATLDTWRVYQPGYFRNLYKSRYLGCCMAFRRDVLRLILPFPRKLPAHDVWIGLLGELNKDIVYIPVPLILYRRHGGNLSTASSKSKNNFFYMVSYRIKLLYLTLGRTINYKLT